MKLSREQLSILLIQIRDDTDTRIEELASFSHFCGIALEQIRVLNVFDKPKCGDFSLDNIDAVLVGGSSEASVLEPERYPFVSEIQQLLLRCIAQRLPTFASCFGFQLAVLALGGKIVHQARDFEMGTLAISLSEYAEEDVLFGSLPNPFMAVSVHRDSALSLPEGCVSLAFTKHCVHALKVSSAPFWASQFHPEVNRSILVQRLSQFREHYTQGDNHLQQVLTAAQETPHSNGLLKAFIDKVVLA
ncbi:type 1 glutamine amidotransferase [Agarivorans aestuarii]|uniref:type 1 glutamine amidotransferase n=1 Tax=Agarivorans aestuarii TaxID=1563703 RepID=UPI001C7E9D13|nr:type 1 glutamine amidotransferase [Agarivorans aestuarii]